MLTISCSQTYRTEREYICRVIFKEFLDLEYRIQYENQRDWRIQGESGGALIVLPDILFQTPTDKWLASMPRPAHRPI